MSHNMLVVAMCCAISLQYSCAHRKFVSATVQRDLAVVESTKTAYVNARNDESIYDGFFEVVEESMENVDNKDKPVMVVGPSKTDHGLNRLAQSAAAEAITETGAKAVTEYSVNASVELEKRKDFFGCDNITCAVEMGKSFGADLVVVLGSEINPADRANDEGTNQRSVLTPTWEGAREDRTERPYSYSEEIQQYTPPPAPTTPIDVGNVVGTTGIVLMGVAAILGGVFKYTSDRSYHNRVGAISAQEYDAFSSRGEDFRHASNAMWVVSGVFLFTSIVAFNSD